MSRFSLTVGCSVLMLAGCGGSGEQYVPVSGTIKLDGQPLAEANVLFEPLPDDKGLAAGKPSVGRTDASGQFTLRTPIGKRPGAAVGKHRVRILTSGRPEFTPEQIEAARKELQKQQSDGGETPTISDAQVKDYLGETSSDEYYERLPARYNQKTELTFEVPEKGSTEANFDLRSR